VASSRKENHGQRLQVRFATGQVELRSFHFWSARPSCYNYYGQVGSGNTALSSRPAAVRGISNAVLVAPGFSHACAALSDGSIKCWGGNSYGQLGDGTKTDRLAPVTVSGF